MGSIVTKEIQFFNYVAKNQITTYFVWYFNSRKKNNSNKIITAQQNRVPNDRGTHYTMLTQYKKFDLINYESVRGIQTWDI